VPTTSDEAVHQRTMKTHNRSLDPPTTDRPDTLVAGGGTQLEPTTTEETTGSDH